MCRWLPLLLTLVPLGAAPVAAATNPRINVTLKRATPAEACQALSRAAGTKIEYVPPAASDKPAADLDSGTSERADFNWTDLSASRALRQLTNQFNLSISPDRDGMGYTLRSNEPNRRPRMPEKFPGFTEVRGHRFWVPQLTVESRRIANFRGEQTMAAPPGHLQIQITAEVPEGDVESIVGIVNLTARDDTGNIMVMVPRPPLPGFRPMLGRGRPFKDQWDEFINLTPPNPRATRLVWVEGDLTAYAANQAQALLFEAPFGPLKAPRAIGELTLENLKLESGPERTELRLECSLPFGPEARAARPDLEVALVGASGKRYDTSSTGANGSGRGDRAVWSVNYGFTTKGDPITQVLVKRTERSQPTLLAHFRMRDIPLPPEGVFVARPVPLPAFLQRAGPGRQPGAEPTSEPLPFHQDGGATLVTRILIGQRTAPAGSLSLGLSRKGESEWSPVRWQELEVATGAVHRLTDLQPGTYRVLRLYGPKESLAIRGPGRWTGAEVEIEAAAGKEVTLPPLEWQPDSPVVAPKPAPAVKPKGPPKK